MSLPENDVVRMQHMLDAGEQALRFCAGRRRVDLDGDVMLRFALVHAITVVGEAAAKISTQTREALPDIAWGSIVGMRNRLVHAYFDIDSDVLWESVNAGLPPLAAQLRAVLQTSE